MLHYQLEALHGRAFGECVIVVGCCADLIRDAIGARFGNVAISYVENEIYDRTNNIYSLWLARRSIIDDILLLEGDLVFEPGLLLDLLDAPYDNVAVVDQYNSTMNGTVIQAGGDLATAMVLKADQPPDFDYGSALKTVNIYKLSGGAVRREVMPRLGEYIAQGQTGDYYEIAFAQAIADGSLRMHVLGTGPRWWTEIDTVDELRHAPDYVADAHPAPEPRADGAARGHAGRSAMSESDDAGETEIDGAVVESYFDGAGGTTAASMSMMAHGHNLPLTAVTHRVAREQRIIGEWLDAVPDSGRVLDVGCGAGAWVEIFANRYASVIGVERSQLMVDAARNRVSPLANAQIISGDARKDLPDGPFELIFAGGLFMVSQPL